MDILCGHFAYRCASNVACAVTKSLKKGWVLPSLCSPVFPFCPSAAHVQNLFFPSGWPSAWNSPGSIANRVSGGKNSDLTSLHETVGTDAPTSSDNVADCGTISMAVVVKTVLGSHFGW